MKAQIWNDRWWVNHSDVSYLYATLNSMLKEARFTVLKKMDKHFSPYGYTALWLLAESHLALHTFPEEGKAYIELSSCNQEKQEQFKALMAEQFNASKPSMDKQELLLKFDKLCDKWKTYEATSSRMQEVRALLVQLDEPINKSKAN